MWQNDPGEDIVPMRKLVACFLASRAIVYFELHAGDDEYIINDTGCMSPLLDATL